MGNEVSHPLPLHTPFRLQLLPVSERGNLINITWRCLSVCSVGLTGGVLVISYMHRIIVNSIESTFISRSIPLTPSVCCLRASDAAAGRSLPLPECHCQSATARDRDRDRDRDCVSQSASASVATASATATATVTSQ